MQVRQVKKEMVRPAWKAASIEMAAPVACARMSSMQYDTESPTLVFGAEIFLQILCPVVQSLVHVVSIVMYGGLKRVPAYGGLFALGECRPESSEACTTRARLVPLTWHLLRRRKIVLERELGIVTIVEPRPDSLDPLTLT